MVYAANLFPHLQSLNPTLLGSEPMPGFGHHPVPSGMNAEGGSKGHLRRLLWTQFQLPKIYRATQASLLFSPIPEMPLSIGQHSWRTGGRTVDTRNNSALKAVVTVHDLIPLRFGQPRSPLTLYQKYYMPAVLRQATHIISNSEATAKDVVDFFGIPAAKITPIPLAYDANHFQFCDRPTQNYLLYLGRCDPYKNVGRLVTAFAQFIQSHPAYAELTLKIAGSYDARYTPLLQQQAQELGVSQQVEFLDYVSYADLPQLLGEAIALVFPSLWEGFGLPVLEAMACGTPVITSNRASLPEVGGDAALLIDPENTDELANAIHTVVTDTTVRMQLRMRGLAQAKQFSWAKTGQATVEVLKPLLS
ncbi:MAG: glycosyltransferase family 4 protein [Merismopedia sp. SIO2A8]|nr:glycosyltransferase family 4 protein [Merismopedia sp. SIO2A8]